MNILVEYLNREGLIENRNFSLTRLEFAKHMAIAGQGYAPRPQKLFRTLGMFLHYSHYLQGQAFYSNSFSEPPAQLSDPTEKGQFSNIAGKAIADFLSKRIDQSIITVNYEAAMKMENPPIPLSINGRQVSRPDLLAFKPDKSSFAIEAKGYSGGCGDMDNHKNQSRSGGISVNYTVASVSYNLYNQVRCKYYDPPNNNGTKNDGLLKKLTQQYYKGLSEFLNKEYFDYHEVKIQDEFFYEVDFLFFLRRLPSEDFFFYWYWPIIELLEFYRPKLILPGEIMDFARNGISYKIKPFIFKADKDQNQNTYVDNDRVGLRIR